jgi:hypothetical protein
VNKHDIDQAVAELVSVLGPACDRDWHVQAGSLEWTCWQTAAHVAHDLIAYAVQVVGSPSSSYLPLDLVVRSEAPPHALLDVIQACGRLLGVAIASADPSSRAWHWGPTDPGGFAALGVNEVLVHTFDIATGLAIEWRPPDDLAAAVLARLQFAVVTPSGHVIPEPPAGEAASLTLLWLTGRIALADHPRLDHWVPKAAR